MLDQLSYASGGGTRTRILPVPEITDPPRPTQRNEVVRAERTWGEDRLAFADCSTT